MSYNATLSYRTGAGVLGYAKVGTSYRAGGFNTNLGDLRQPLAIPAAYDDETATSYEIGLKGTPARNVYFALAGYFTELKDLIAQTDNGCRITLPACPVAATSFLTNAGDAESWGVEAELVAGFDIDTGHLRAALSGSRQGGEVKSGQFAGLPLPQVPDWLASAHLNLRQPIGPDTAIVANILYSAQWGGVQELRAQRVPLDDFGIVNLRLGIEHRGFSLSAFANNIGNSVYLVAQDATIRRHSQPRVIGVEARVRW